MMQRMTRISLGGVAIVAIVASTTAFRPFPSALEGSSASPSTSTTQRHRCDRFPPSRGFPLHRPSARRSRSDREWGGWRMLQARISDKGCGGGDVEELEPLDAAGIPQSSSDVPSVVDSVDAKQAYGSDDAAANIEGWPPPGGNRMPCESRDGVSQEELALASSAGTSSGAVGKEGGKKNAARAAVAVIEDIQVRELERDRGGGAGRGRSKTTLGAMVEACFAANMTESRAQYATQIFVYALAGVALCGELEQVFPVPDGPSLPERRLTPTYDANKEDLVLEVVLKIYSEDPDWSVSTSEATTDATDATTSSPSVAPAAIPRVLIGDEAIGEGDLGLEKEKPKEQQQLKPVGVCVFEEDELLAGLSAWNPSIANEVEAMLMSKPRSTPFSRLALESFQLWMEAFFIEPIQVSPAVAESLNLSGGPDASLSVVVKAAFDEASGIIPGALVLAEGDEVKFLKRQRAVDVAGLAVFSQLGEPRNDIVLSAELVDRFADEVLPEMVSVSERMRAACGLSFVRCQWRTDVGTVSPEQLSRKTREALEDIGLNTEMKVFLTEDTIQGYDNFIDLATQLGKLEAMDTSGPSPGDLPSLDNLQALLRGRGNYDDRQNSQANSKSLLFALVPSKTEPSNKPLVRKLGLALLALTAPIGLFVFCTEAFGLDAFQVVQDAIDGNPASLTKAAQLWLLMAGLFVVRESARFLLAARGGIRLEYPRVLPCPQTGLLPSNTLFKSYPKNGKELFDVVIGGPVVGFLSSSMALVMGLHMTSEAMSSGVPEGLREDALAGFPSLPSSVLQGSLLLGSLVDFLLHTNLGSEDIAAAQIAIHPLGVAGVAATLWNAASMLPLLGSDGKTAMDAIEADSPAISIASFAAYVFATMRSFSDTGDLVLAVLLAATFAYPQTSPILREDNVTPIRDPARLLLALLVGVVSICVLSPMKVTPFLAPSAMMLGTGAGAESVAAGFGVGGIGFKGFL